MGSSEGKSRSLSGNVAVCIFIIGLVCVVLAFTTSAWIVSSTRITNAKFNQLGLWRHCFRSLPDPVEADAPKRFFSGCRWVFDPFTAGYDRIRGFLIPPFMVATEFFFTICFLAFVVTLGLNILYTTCWDPEHKYYVYLIKGMSYILAGGSFCGCIAVIIFAIWGNGRDWMPGPENNYFGWSFVLAIIGSLAGLLAALLYLVESNIQYKKRRNLKESQTRFQLESRVN